MLTHVVVLTLTESASAEDRERITAGLAGLAGQIPGLDEVVVRQDLGLAEGNADLAFAMSFADEDAWRSYSSHPAHVELATHVIKPVVTAKVALQYR